ncbi:MAG: leucine-rich repeat domain-containing protein [Bacteroidota bacterium]
MKKVLIFILAISFFAKFAYAQVSQSEFDALVALYNTTGGDNWTQKTGWSTTTNDVSSSWYGVTVTGGRVTEIDLSYNNLVGEIPVEIGNLTALTKLNLRNNTLSGLPAEIGNLTLLTYLMLNYNAITNIPAEIANLSVLTELSIGQNELTTIPSEVYSLTSLITLNIGFNQLTNISAGIGNLTNLTTLFVNGNELTSIPTEIGSLIKLRYLYLNENQLASIPSSIGNLTELYELHINDNQLTSIPSEIGNLSGINWIYLFNNKLTGIPQEINNLTTLTRLTLDHNELVDLPDLSGLTNLGMLYIDNNTLDFGDLEKANVNWSAISFNNYSPQAEILLNRTEADGQISFSCNVSGINNQYKWFKNDVEIIGETSSSITVENNAYGMYYCTISDTSFPNLTLKTNEGTIGSFTNGVFSEDYNALIALYDATNGGNWTVKTNWKSNEVVDSWYGVTVTGGRVTEIDLSYNNLVGEIPVEIGNLTALTKLNLRNNTLSGLPAEIGNLTLLTYLMLNYNAITNIPAEIANLSVLTELSIGQNELTTIPSEVYSLTSLITLNIGFNQLTNISAGIGNLTNLTTLFVNGNELTSIPTEIGSLIKLRYLYLNENQLASIPSSIGNLTELYELHINDNQLTSIPSEIGNLSGINWIYLFNNKLTGIPQEINNLTTLTRLTLDHNELVDLPDLSGLTNLGMLYIDNNALDFGDLEKANVNWSAISYKNYSPQEKVGEIKDVYGDLGQTVQLVVEVGGGQNDYQWFKDGNEITNSNNDTLIIASFDSDDKGTYTCNITNSVAPDLTLESEPFNLVLTGIYDVRKEFVKVFPNPSNGQFKINLDELPSQNSCLEILDLSGKIIYRQKLEKIQNQISIEGSYQGTFLLQILDDKKVYEKHKILIIK